MRKKKTFPNQNLIDALKSYTDQNITLKDALIEIYRKMNNIHSMECEEFFKYHLEEDSTITMEELVQQLPENLLQELKNTMCKKTNTFVDMPQKLEKLKKEIENESSI
jgi:hypothetical protein